MDIVLGQYTGKAGQYTATWYTGFSPHQPSSLLREIWRRWHCCAHVVGSFLQSHRTAQEENNTELIIKSVELFCVHLGFLNSKHNIYLLHKIQHSVLHKTVFKTSYLSNIYYSSIETLMYLRMQLVYLSKKQTTSVSTGLWTISGQVHSWLTRQESWEQTDILGQGVKSQGTVENDMLYPLPAPLI